MHTQPEVQESTGRRSPLTSSLNCDDIRMGENLSRDVPAMGYGCRLALAGAKQKMGTHLDFDSDTVGGQVPSRLTVYSRKPLSVLIE